MRYLIEIPETSEEQFLKVMKELKAIVLEKTNIEIRTKPTAAQEAVLRRVANDIKEGMKEVKEGKVHRNVEEFLNEL